MRVWSTVTLKPVYIIDTYTETGAGDLFCISWSPSLQTIYIGCQNTSLQWFKFIPASSINSGTTTPNASAIRKAHKFFDSYPQSERKPADVFAHNGPSTANTSFPLEAPRLAIPATNVIESEHYGYIYCMAVLAESSAGAGVTLATGSGDETVKVWKCTTAGPTIVHTFECNFGAVLALVARSDTLYAGCQDGHIKVLDLETRTLVRSIIVQEAVDVLSLSLIGTDLYTCSANGQVTVRSCGLGVFTTLTH